MSDRYLIKMPKIIYYYPTKIIEVNPTSSILHRRAVEKIGKYFQREFNYDFMPYDSDYNNSYAYLFTEHHPYKIMKNDNWILPVYGAACFRDVLKQGETIPIWKLDWIWIHPYKRNKGILQENWKFFKERFGDFKVSHPLSKSMVGFLKNNGEDISKS